MDALKEYIEESFKIHPYTYTLMEIEEPSPKNDYYKLIFDASIYTHVDIYDSLDSSCFDPPTKEYVYIKKHNDQILYGIAQNLTNITWLPFKESATIPETAPAPVLFFDEEESEPHEPTEIEMMNLLIDSIQEILK